MKSVTETRRIDELIESRVKNIDKIQKAVEKIKSLHRHCPRFNSVKEVRKWRER